MASTVQSVGNLMLAVGLLTVAPLNDRRALAQQPPAPAQAQHETFTAKTINLAVGAGQDLKIDVFRWSTDDERKAIVAALKDKGDAGLAEALPKSPSLGSLWTSESLGYTIRYAYRDATANGSDRVVVLIDRRLGSWAGQIWKTPASSGAPDYPFVLIELHLSRTGAGEGKMSLSTKVAAEETGMTLALASYNAAPVLLRPVKHEPERQR